MQISCSPILFRVRRIRADGDTVQIAIHPTEEAIAREIFAALEDGGQVVMPLQKTDWSPLYGIVKDKFGVTFQVNVPGE